MSKALIIIIVLLLIIGAIWLFAFFLPKNSNNQQNGEKALSTFMVQGVKIEVLREGSGPVAKAGNTLTVNYVNMLPSGKKIYSTYDAKRTYTFVVGQSKVIAGWDIGLLGMKAGEKRRLTMPPNLVYGEKGFQSAGIPPDSTLISEIELIKLK